MGRRCWEQPLRPQAVPMPGSTPVSSGCCRGSRAAAWHGAGGITRRDSHLQTSLLNHLPSANICQVQGDISGFKSHRCRHFNPPGLAAAGGRAGWQPPGVAGCPDSSAPPNPEPQLPTEQPLRPACSSVRRARTPSTLLRSTSACLAWMLPPWAPQPVPPLPGRQHRPSLPSCPHPHFCTRTAISIWSTCSLQPST